MKRPAVTPGILLGLLLIAAPAPAGSDANSPDQASVSPHPVNAVVAASTTQVFVGTFGGGIYRSIDRGKTWADRNNGLEDLEVLAIAALSRGSVFAGTFGGGVYRWDGQAARWVERNAGLGCHEVICLSATQDGGVYAGTSSGGVYYSGDDGESWTPAGLMGKFVGTLTVDPSGWIYASTDEGLFRSDDRGRTWEQTNTGLTCKEVWGMAVHPGGMLFAATNGDGVFRSFDGGASWEKVGAGLASRNVGSISVCPLGKVFVGTTEGVYCSADEGTSWRKVEGDVNREVARCLTVIQGGDLVAGTYRGTVLTTHPLPPLPEEGTHSEQNGFGVDLEEWD